MSLSEEVGKLRRELSSLKTRQISINPNDIIYSALGEYVIYGCLVTEGADATDQTVKLEGQASGDSDNHNPDFQSNPSRGYQYANIASGKDGAFRSQDTTTDVGDPPATGTARYDIAYVFVGPGGSGFSIQEGSPSSSIKTDFDSNGLDTSDYGSSHDPSLPVGALPVARIYVEDDVTGIPDSRIADIRDFEGRLSGVVDQQFASPPELGSDTPNTVNATDITATGSATISGGTQIGSSLQFNHLTGNTDSNDLVYAINNSEYTPSVGDTVHVESYSSSAPKYPAVWECTSDSESDVSAQFISGAFRVGTFKFEPAGKKVNAFEYGAKGDGSTDDASTLNEARDYCLGNDATLELSEATYLCGTTVNFRRITLEARSAVIDVAHDGIGVLLGGNSANSINPTQYVNQVKRSSGSDSFSTPTVRIVGAKGQHITVLRTTYLQIYADTDSSTGGTDASSAYSAFDIKSADTLELGNNPSSDGSDIQWINENQITINRTNEVIIGGTYSHNNNVFHGGNLESNASISINNGNSNHFTNTRWEGNGLVTFGGDTRSNTIVQSCSINNLPNEEVTVSPDVTNNGDPSNRVVRLNEQYLETNTVHSSTFFDTRVDTQKNIGGTSFARAPQPSACCITARRTIAPCDESDFFRVHTGDYIEVTVDSGQYRPRILFYDSGAEPFTLSSGDVDTQANETDNWIGKSSNSSNINCRVNNSNIAYAKAILESGSDLSQATAKKWQVDVTNRVRTTSSRQIARGRKRDIVTGSPTQGFAPLGKILYKDDGSAYYQCIFSLHTKLSSDAASGATSIDVDANDGNLEFSFNQPISSISAGDLIGIQINPAGTHFSTVSSVSSNTITINDALPEAVTAGDRVIVNRWA